MNKPLAPIVLFIYNRPHYLRRTLESLEKNSLAQDSLLFIYSDGPKDNASADEIRKINECRHIAKSKPWCKEIRVVERTYNLGLAKSIISGVTEIIQEYGSIIVLEDDLELSPFFLKFMNDSLILYERDLEVLSIGACNFFAPTHKLADTFFIPKPDCLGWATWRDRWTLFEQDGQRLLGQLEEKNLLTAFNLNGAYDFEKLLRNQIAGITDSWAIRWHAVSYIENKLNLYSKYALTNHIGIDASATNSEGVDYSNSIVFPSRAIEIKRRHIRIDDQVMKYMVKYFKGKRHTRPVLSLMLKSKRVIKSILNRISRRWL